MKHVLMTIAGMECPNCSMNLERIEDRLDGVERVEASYVKGQMQVDYDERRVSEEQIRAEVVRLGFQVTDVKIRK